MAALTDQSCTNSRLILFNTKGGTDNAPSHMRVKTLLRSESLITYYSDFTIGSKFILLLPPGHYRAALDYGPVSEANRPTFSVLSLTHMQE